MDQINKEEMNSPIDQSISRGEACGNYARESCRSLGRGLGRGFGNGKTFDDVKHLHEMKHMVKLKHEEYISDGFGGFGRENGQYWAFTVELGRD